MSGRDTRSLRLFIALWPPEPVRAELDRLARSCARDCRGRPTARENLHLTLVFLGAAAKSAVEPLAQMMDAAIASAFVLRFDDCGWWRRNGIVWAGSAAPPDELSGLHDRLARGAERIGFGLDVRPYVPHLTLVRDAVMAPPAALVAPIEWPVDSVVLVASELSNKGPNYRIVHEARARTGIASSAGGAQAAADAGPGR